MALRAGYFGLKRFEKNKLSVLAASIPADIGPDNPIAGKNDVLATVDLMKDTTGWLGGNVCKRFESQTKNGGTFTVDDEGIVSLSGTTSAQTYVSIDEALKAGTYILDGAPDGSSIGSYDMFISNMDESGVPTIARDYAGATTAKKFTLNATTNIRIACRVPQGDLDTTKQFKPMILTEEQYALNPAYRPYHESVAEMLDGKLSIGSMLTSADDLNDIKTSGIYSFSTSPANTPEGVVYGTLIVEGNSSGSTGVRQLIIVSGTSSGIIYTRGYDGSPQTWKSWFKFTGTEVTPPSPTPESETKKATKKKVIKEEEE